MTSLTNQLALINDIMESQPEVVSDNYLGDTACIMDDMMKSVLDDNEVAVRSDARRLAAQLIHMSTGSRNTRADSVTSEADTRLDRLSRVMESARYQLDESSRRMRLEHVVKTLQDVVDKMKKDLHGEQQQQQQQQEPIQQLNIYEQRPGELVCDCS